MNGEGRIARKNVVLSATRKGGEECEDNWREECEGRSVRSGPRGRVEGRSVTRSARRTGGRSRGEECEEDWREE